MLKQPLKIKAYLRPLIHKLVRQLHGDDVGINDIVAIFHWNPTKQRIHQILNPKDEKQTKVGFY